MRQQQNVDVLVVGGGIAGLTAAVVAARAGRTVTVFDSGELGGRGATHVENGYHLNQGPHALYRAGAAHRIFRELGIPIHGAPPASTGAWASRDGKLHRLPAGSGSLLTSDLFGLGTKLELAKFLAGVPHEDAAPIQGETLERWLESRMRHADGRALLHAVFRLSTYGNDPAAMSAGAALEQFRIARESVLYLDNGWASLINGLRDAAELAGAATHPDTPIRRVLADGPAVELADGTVVEGQTVIVTARPAVAARLLHGSDGPVPAWAEQTPVRAACLDLGLRRLPHPDRLFALGIDRPYYYSVHSAVARLAPEGRVALHAAKYLPAGESSRAAELEEELEAWMNQVQPGWRDEVEVRRFLPNMVVTNALVTARMGGTAGRPAIDAAGIPGVFLAGDWVGPEGMLVDVSAASAVQAAEAAVRSIRGGRDREYALIP